MAQTTVNFNLKNAGYVDYANQTLTFKLLTVGAEAASGNQNYVTLPGIVTATSDANGDGSVVLYRNGKSDIQSIYEVILPNREKARFIIPSDIATIELATLIVDHVPGGSNTQQSSVYAEAIKRSNHTGDLKLGGLDNGAITGTLAIANGGTNASTASAARTSLELGTIATQAYDSVDIDGGAIDATVIGANAAAAGTFSALTAPTTNLTAVGDKNFITTAQLTKLDSIGTAAAVSNFVPNSITFTDTSTYLRLADTDDHLDVGTGDFSLSFWARLDSDGTEPVLTKLSGTGYRLKFVSGKLILTMSDTSASADFELATGLNDNKWHVYVVSIDRSGNATTYVDNVAQTPLRDVSGTALSLDNGGEFRIGSDGGTNAGDGIALGNYVALHKGSSGALTAAQASQIFFSADSALKLLNPVVAPSLMVDLRKADKTFTDLSANGLTVTTNGTIIFNEGRITSLDGATIGATTPAAVTGTNVLASSTLGYKAGSGGSATAQGTNKSTEITLNKINGKMTMHNESMSANDIKTFQFTNNTIAATDVVIVNIADGGTAGNYLISVSDVSTGHCKITLKCIAGSGLTDALVLNFAVIKAVQS